MSTRLFSKWRLFKEKADEWISSKRGVRFRYILYGATVTVYPIWHLTLSGPFIKYVFPRSHSISYSLPDHLQRIVEEQYSGWLERESEETQRLQKDACVKFCLQKDATEKFDTVAQGSLSVKSGAHVALPFYTKFKDEDEALGHCQKNFEPFKFMGKTICVIWDSSAGSDLVRTFALSKNALAFLISRDLYQNDGWNAFANRATCWATFTTFSSFFTMFVYFQGFKQKGFIPFALLYLGFLAAAAYGSLQWHYLYVHLNFLHADRVAACISENHLEGGKEYYIKMLKRNRILRDMVKNGNRLFSAAGNDRSAISSYMSRFELLRDVKHDEILSVKKERSLLADEEFDDF